MSVALSALVQSHYYSEDFELLSAVRAFAEALPPGEADELKAVILSRMAAEGSMVDILLCSVVDVPGAVPLLADRLDRETAPSQLTRALISALQRYPCDAAFRAVERFVDSDQEGEALAAIARIDFLRAVPYIVRSLDREYLHGPILHMLHERRKRVGLPALAVELAAVPSADLAALRRRLVKALDSKAAAFNPFPESERQRLRAVLE